MTLQKTLLGQAQKRNSCSLNTLGVGAYIVDTLKVGQQPDQTQISKILAMCDAAHNTYSKSSEFKKKRESEKPDQDPHLTFEEGLEAFNSANSKLPTESQFFASVLEGKSECYPTGARNKNEYIAGAINSCLQQLQPNETAQIICKGHAIVVGRVKNQYWLFDAKETTGDNTFQSFFYMVDQQVSLGLHLIDKYKEEDAAQIESNKPPIEIHFFQVLPLKPLEKKKQETKSQAELLSEFLKQKNRNTVYPNVDAALKANKPSPEQSELLNAAYSHMQTKNVKTAMKMVLELKNKKMTDEEIEAQKNWTDETKTVVKQAVQQSKPVVLMTLVPDHKDKKKKSDEPYDLIKVDDLGEFFENDVLKLVQVFNEAGIKINLGQPSAEYKVIGVYNRKTEVIDFHIQGTGEKTSKPATKAILDLYRKEQKREFAQEVMTQFADNLNKKNVFAYAQTRETVSFTKRNTL